MANGGDFIQIMADKSQKRPFKGILKTSSSFEKQDKTSKKTKAKATKWDEMNIIATLHPVDKDYGHMKIEEPKTPFNWEVDDDDDVDGRPKHALDPSELARKLKDNAGKSPRKDAFDRESDDSDADISAEELARRKVFKSKRKMHYNEFKVVEFARKLIKADEEALENDELDNRPTSSAKTRKSGLLILLRRGTTTLFRGFHLKKVKRNVETFPKRDKMERWKRDKNIRRPPNVEERATTSSTKSVVYLRPKSRRFDCRIATNLLPEELQMSYNECRRDCGNKEDKK